MKLYLASFDLLQSGDYDSLRRRLVSMQARQILQNLWALQSAYSAAQIKNLLRQFIDQNDRLVIAEVGAEWASRRALANLGELRP